MDLYTLHGTDIPAVYASRPFPYQTRRDERNFIDFDAPLYRVVMEEYEVAGEVPRSPWSK
jgi:hypothetical protein